MQRRKAKEGGASSDEIGIHVIDDHTLKVELERPTPYFLQLTVHPLYSPVHRLIDQQHPQWPYQCENNYPCNGPFQLKINQPNQAYQFVKNPFYWDASNIVLDQINWTLMNPSQAIHSFHKKEIDWLGNPFGDWYSFYKPRNDDRVVSFPNSWVCWFVSILNVPHFTTSSCAELSHAIQRSQIVSYEVTTLTPAYSLIHPHARIIIHMLFFQILIQKRLVT